MGLKTYFTGEPCLAGHVADRRTCNHTCVECALEKTRLWRAKNKEHLADYQCRYLKENRTTIMAKRKEYWAERPEELKAKKAKDHQNHKAKRLATMKLWRKNNPERVREFARMRAAANPEQYRTYKRNYKARKKSAAGKHTAQDIAEIFELQRGKCAICRKRLGAKYHVDHIQPLALGGTNNRSNLQLTHGACNQSKHAKDPVVFMQERGMLL